MQVQQSRNGRPLHLGTLGKIRGYPGMGANRLPAVITESALSGMGGGTVERVTRFANRRAPGDRQSAVTGAERQPTFEIGCFRFCPYSAIRLGAAKLIVACAKRQWCISG
jgi:hypothetical protein